MNIIHQKNQGSHKNYRLFYVETKSMALSSEPSMFIEYSLFDSTLCSSLAHASPPPPPPRISDHCLVLIQIKSASIVTSHHIRVNFSNHAATMPHASTAMLLLLVILAFVHLASTVINVKLIIDPVNLRLVGTMVIPLFPSR